MTIVLVDRKNDKLNESFGVESIMDISFFSEKYGDRILSAFSVLEPEEILVLSNIKRQFGSCEKTISFDNTDSLLDYINNTNDDSFLISFTDVYFEPIEGLFKFQTEFYSIVFFNDDNMICMLLSKKHTKLFFSDYSIDSVDNEKYIDKKSDFKGYFKQITNIFDYQELLNDTLYGKNSVILPRMAQGVFADTEIPKGDFVIIPPVYFGKGVQIESGCVIGPETVILNDSLIAKNSNVTKSIIFNNNFISSDCFVDGAICCPNVVIRRNSVVFPDSVLSNNCTVGEECIIDNGSYLKPFSKIDELKKKYINYRYESSDSPAGFYGYLPEKAALLGAAIGTVFDSPSIAVASDGEPNSTALKLAVLGGAMTTGAQCYDFGNTFLSSMHYFMSYCRLSCAVFVSGDKNGTVISVFSKNNDILTNGQYYSIKNLLTTGDIARCCAEGCKSIRQIHGMQRMYIQNLIKGFTEKLDFLPIFMSKNKYIESVGEIAVSKVVGDYSVGKKRILFNVNSAGTGVSVECDGITFNHQKLKELCSFFTNEHRFYNLKEEFLWEFDALYLSFKVIQILSDNKLSLTEAFAMLPDFYISQTEIPQNMTMGKLASKLSSCGNLLYKNGQLRILSKDSQVRIKKINDGKLLLTVDSASVEMADEIAGDLLRLIDL